MAVDTSYPAGVAQRRQDGNIYVPTGKSLNIESGASFVSTDGVIDGSHIKVLGDASVVGTPEVIISIAVADASANTDVILTKKMRVIGASGLNTGIAAHASLDTWQVKNGATAITDAVAKTATVNAIKAIATIDPAAADIAAGGTLRIAAVKNTNAAVTVYVRLIPVA